MARIVLTFLFLGLNTSFGSEPNAVYLHEGFNGAGLPAGWSQFRISGTAAAWSVVGVGSNPPVPPLAGSGQVMFNSFDAAVGEQARLVSPSITLTSATDPFISFFMYHEDEYPASYDSVYVEATTGDSISGPWVMLLGLRRPRMVGGWSHEIVSLYPYLGTSRLFLSLRGVSKYGNNILVDEMRVADSSFHDLAMNTLLPDNIPTEMPKSSAVQTSSRSPGKKRDVDTPVIMLAHASQLLIRAVTRNLGTYNEASYSIGWKVDNQLQTSVAGNPVAARTGRDTVTLMWPAPTPGLHTVTAWTILGSDSNRTNDTSRVTFHVLETGTFFFEAFNGTTFPPANWIVINRDGGQLSPWFPGADTSAFVPFEGSGFAANNFQRTFGTYLDDYLITPAIAGVGQPGMVDSLVFRARSQFNPPPAANFPDSLMVLVSTGGADTADFTILLDYFAVPKTGWERRAYPLSNRVPANSTLRIAFRYLLFNVLPASGSGDFIGVDAVQLIRSLPASATETPDRPQCFELLQNYPNPFNPTTAIGFQLSAASFVKLSVYDMLGREVAALVNEVKAPGSHGVTWDARAMASGVYLYRMQIRMPDGGQTTQEVRKMVLLR